jgi:hypothetical protein
MIRSYIYSILVVFILLLSGTVGWKIRDYSFDKYKLNQAEQVQIAQLNKQKIEEEDNAKLKQAQDDYRRDTTILAERLRDLKAVSWGADMPLAGSVRDKASVSTETSPTCRVSYTLEAATRTRQGNEFYSKALEDTLQCSNLIKWEKSIENSKE